MELRLSYPNYVKTYLANHLQPVIIGMETESVATTGILHLPASYVRPLTIGF